MQVRDVKERRQILEESMGTSSRFVTPKQFMADKGLPRNTVYEGIKDGTIPSIRISKRKILIPIDAFERMLAGQPNDN